MKTMIEIPNIRHTITNNVANKIAQKIARGEFVDESPASDIWRQMRGMNMSDYLAIRRGIFAASACEGNRWARLAAFRRESGWVTQARGA